MSAEGSLYNPFIFDGVYPPCWEPALEYLDLVELYPCPVSYIRGHLFKICHHILALPENFSLRTRMADRSTIDDFRDVSLTGNNTHFDFGLGPTVQYPRDTI